MIKLDTHQGILSILHDRDSDGELFIEEDEARQLMNDLYDYFEAKDREALARYLTRKKQPDTL